MLQTTPRCPRHTGEPLWKDTTQIHRHIDRWAWWCGRCQHHHKANGDERAWFRPQTRQSA
ncbi:hypothetical protein ACFFHI_20305 [Streptomyces palmae]|uniref:hypothetical protein n=1 Tax=Streptomyces palmae TaxID=1701085 RepID=UPI0035E8C9B9